MIFKPHLMLCEPLYRINVVILHRKRFLMVKVYG